eukprot:TRINITY_DN10553_c0_g1_i1.p1 TRINITY_DN10553_c0_g1~~TRINITY_DN10553_c0_g1_i1.p1  ORF type:complete len:352 (+),score=65.96 TRINITY_DN10553_c0_g1_i1:144-1199(+)
MSLAYESPLMARRKLNLCDDSSTLDSISPPDRGDDVSEGTISPVRLNNSLLVHHTEGPGSKRRKRKSLVPDALPPAREKRCAGGLPKKGQFHTPVKSERLQGLEELLSKVVECSVEDKNRLSTGEDHSPFEITPWIFCGTAKYACQAERVAEDGFSHVINMCPDQQLTPATLYHPHGIQLTLIDARDTHDYPLLCNHFAQCLRITEYAKSKKQKVLLHCLKAVNRSVAMAIALRVAQEGSKLPDAVQSVALKRAPVLQNMDFRRQLIHFSENMQMYCQKPLVSPRMPLLCNTPERNSKRKSSTSDYSGGSTSTSSSSSSSSMYNQIDYDYSISESRYSRRNFTSSTLVLSP